jgi:NADPH:quinone reductase-like Zn-dependent oxidoreductase
VGTAFARQTAWMVDRPGRIGDLRLADAPLPEPGPEEVRIAVHAVGLNRHDLRFIGGAGDAAWPRIPGVDVVGRIEAAGGAVRGWRLGTRVMALLDPARGGGFADYAIAPALALTPVPRDVEDVAAAGLPSAAFAAFHAIERRLQPREGQSVLVFGASGGVGGFAVQFAASRRARVLAVHSGHARDHVLALGATEALDRTGDDIAAMVRALTDGRGVDAVLDVVGRAHATDCLALLRPEGALACVAGLPSLRGRDPLAAAMTLHEIAPAAVYRSTEPARLRDLAVVGRALLRRLANGNLRALTAEIVAFDAVPDALLRLAAGGIRGRIVARRRA